MCVTLRRACNIWNVWAVWWLVLRAPQREVNLLPRLSSSVLLCPLLKYLLSLMAASCSLWTRELSHRIILLGRKGSVKGSVVWKWSLGEEWHEGWGRVGKEEEAIWLSLPPPLVRGLGGKDQCSRLGPLMAHWKLSHCRGTYIFHLPLSLLLTEMKRKGLLFKSLQGSIQYD